MAQVTFTVPKRKVIMFEQVIRNTMFENAISLSNQIGIVPAPLSERSWEQMTEEKKRIAENVVVFIPEEFLNMFGFFRTVKKTCHEHKFLEEDNVKMIHPPLTYDECMFLCHMIHTIVYCKPFNTIKEYVMFFDIANAMILDEKVIEFYFDICVKALCHNFFQFTYEFMECNIKRDPSRSSYLEKIINIIAEKLYVMIKNDICFSQITPEFIGMQKTRSLLCSVIKNVVQISQETILYSLWESLQKPQFNLSAKEAHEIFGSLNWKFIQKSTTENFIREFVTRYPNFVFSKKVIKDIIYRENLLGKQEFYIYYPNMDDMGLHSENQYVQTLKIDEAKAHKYFWLYQTNTKCKLVTCRLSVKKISDNKAILMIYAPCNYCVTIYYSDGVKQVLDISKWYCNNKLKFYRVIDHPNITDLSIKVIFHKID